MTDRPNVLLVTVDSLRADHVFGDGAETPALDTLARDGVAFERAFAQGPYTTFSMPSLFTSRYPSQLTSIDFVEGVEGVLVDDAPTIQQRLRDVGYTTAGIHSNPLLSRLFGFDVGFDHFYDGVGGIADRFSGRLGLLANKLRRLVQRRPYVSAEDITDRAIEWLRATEERPVFLWVHYMDTHGPYQSREGLAYLEKYRAELLWRKAVRSPGSITTAEHERLAEAYVEEVEYTDEHIGRLLDAFDDAVDGDDNLVVVTADHGDEFGEHGSYSHESKLYEELVHVPLAAKPPASASIPASRSDHLVPLLDVGATIVDVGDGSLSGFQGSSLFDHISRHERDDAASRSADDDGEHVLSEARLAPGYIGAVRSRRWKFIDHGGRHELYDLAADPGETTNVADDHPDRVAAFERRLAAHREEQAGSRREEPAVDSGELDEQLRSLGYLE